MRRNEHCEIRLLAPMDADVVLESVPFPARSKLPDASRIVAAICGTRGFSRVTRAMRASA
jgi:hypothetical protein